MSKTIKKLQCRRFDEVVASVSNKKGDHVQFKIAVGEGDSWVYFFRRVAVSDQSERCEFDLLEGFKMLALRINRSQDKEGVSNGGACIEVESSRPCGRLVLRELIFDDWSRGRVFVSRSIDRVIRNAGVY